LFILFSSLEGLGRGFLQGIVDLVGFIASLGFATYFYSIFALFLRQNFSLPYGISNAVGFMVAFFAFETVFLILVALFYKHIFKIFSFGQVRLLNTLLGIFPALFSALIFASFLLSLLLSLPIRGDIKEQITDSRFGGFLTQKTTAFEGSLKKIFGQAFIETLNFLTVETQGGEVVNLHFTTDKLEVDSLSENRMFYLINKERQRENVPSLKQDDKLQELARTHCKDMFVRGYFSHYTPEGLSPFDRMSKFGIEYKLAGENLAYAPNVDIAHRGLMNSPGHRENILNPGFLRVGIGVINGGIYGEMFCQELAD